MLNKLKDRIFRKADRYAIGLTVGMSIVSISMLVRSSYLLGGGDGIGRVADILKKCEPELYYEVGCVIADYFEGNYNK